MFQSVERNSDSDSMRGSGHSNVSKFRIRQMSQAPHRRSTSKKKAKIAAQRENAAQLKEMSGAEASKQCKQRGGSCKKGSRKGHILGCDRSLAVAQGIITKAKPNYHREGIGALRSRKRTVKHFFSRQSSGAAASASAGPGGPEATTDVATAATFVKKRPAPPSPLRRVGSPSQSSAKPPAKKQRSPGHDARSMAAPAPVFTLSRENSALSQALAKAISGLGAMPRWRRDGDKNAVVHVGTHAERANDRVVKEVVDDLVARVSALDQVVEVQGVLEAGLEEELQNITLQLWTTSRAHHRLIQEEKRVRMQLAQLEPQLRSAPPLPPPKPEDALGDGTDDDEEEDEDVDMDPTTTVAELWATSASVPWKEKATRFVALRRPIYNSKTVPFDLFELTVFFAFWANWKADDGFSWNRLPNLVVSPPPIDLPRDLNDPMELFSARFGGYSIILVDFSFITSLGNVCPDDPSQLAASRTSTIFDSNRRFDFFDRLNIPVVEVSGILIYSRISISAVLY